MRSFAIRAPTFAPVYGGKGHRQGSDAEWEEDTDQ